MSIGICFNDDVPWGTESHRIDNLKDVIKKIYRENERLSKICRSAANIATENGDHVMATAFMSKYQGLQQANLNMIMYLEGYDFSDTLKGETK